MHVTSYDICVQGFERLRSQTEILLSVPVCNLDSDITIREALTDEIQCCMRGEGEYEALEAAVTEWWRDAGNDVHHACRCLEDESEGEESCCYLFVYIDSGADQPVYQF